MWGKVAARSAVVFRRRPTLVVIRVDWTKVAGGSALHVYVLSRLTEDTCLIDGSLTRGTWLTSYLRDGASFIIDGVLGTVSALAFAFTVLVLSDGTRVT